MNGSNLPLSDQVYDEDAVCNLLRVNKTTLSALRLRKKLPYVPLNKTHRVYLAEDVLNWLIELRRIPSE